MKEERDEWRREGRAGMGLEGTEEEGRGQYEKGGREGEQRELKGEGIEREESEGKGPGGEGRGEQGWDWKGRKEKGGDSMRRGVEKGSRS